MPTPHTRQPVVPPVEYAPVPHSRQALAPLVFPYCPATQSAHDEAFPGANAPLPQVVQVVSPSPLVKVPPGQPRQSALLCIFPYVPGGQLPHTLAPTCANTTTPQARHCVAPGKGENVPSSHGKQVRLVSYAPAAQGTHPSVSEGPPMAVPYLPRGQATQSRTEVLPVELREVWIGQDRHSLAPSVGLYVPSGQGEHAAWPPENVPAEQLRHVVAPSGEYLPVPHARHTRPSSYVPALHGMHANAVDDPVNAFVVPFGQGMQSLTEVLFGASR